jgi:hypothetical protein
MYIFILERYAQGQRQMPFRHRDVVTGAVPDYCQMRKEWALPVQYG